MRSMWKTFWCAWKVIILLVFIPMVVYADVTRIAITNFKVYGDDPINNIEHVVSNALTTAFVKSKSFKVIERELLSEVLDEQNLIMSGVINEEDVTKIGKLYDVVAIVAGSIYSIEERIEINARIIEVSGASVIAAESIVCTNIGDLQKSISILAFKLTNEYFDIPASILSEHMEYSGIDISVSQMKVTSNVIKARVYLLRDRKWMYEGKTPCVIEGLYPGSHTIRVTKIGYEKLEDIIELDNGDNVIVKASLKGVKSGLLYGVGKITVKRRGTE